MPDYCFLNGEILKVEEATIGIYDLGFLRGYAAFDFLRTYNGKPFRLKDHLYRFRQSAKELRLTLAYTDSFIEEIILELIQKSNRDEAGIRLILTGGYASDSISLGNPNFLIIIEKLPGYDPAIYEKGIKLITHKFQRQFAESKTTEYKTAIQLQQLKSKKNAFDVLYYKNGLALETTRSNIFHFKCNSLITPKRRILQGITRKVVLELAKPLYSIEERDVSMDELLMADEVFMSGTSKMVIPVVQIDETRIANGKPGKNTEKLLQKFREYARNWQGENK
jgi:branched-subunit amino acid aminotransferase/4-amino-4-deoxychorismate lyase